MHIKWGAMDCIFWLALFDRKRIVIIEQKSGRDDPMPLNTTRDAGRRAKGLPRIVCSVSGAKSQWWYCIFDYPRSGDNLKCYYKHRQMIFTVIASLWPSNFSFWNICFSNWKLLYNSIDPKCTFLMLAYFWRWCTHILWCYISISHCSQKSIFYDIIFIKIVISSLIIRHARFPLH